MIISVDHGNKQIKTVHKTFTSGLMCSDIPFPLSSDSLFYNGKYYALTDEIIPYMRNKTVNDKFFVLTLFAIAYELTDAGKYISGLTSEINLAIGLPPGHFGKQYKQFEKYFTRNEIINFEFNQKKFKIIRIILSKSHSIYFSFSIPLINIYTRIIGFFCRFSYKLCFIRKRNLKFFLYHLPFPPLLLYFVFRPHQPNG